MRSAQRDLRGLLAARVERTVAPRKDEEACCMAVALVKTGPLGPVGVQSMASGSSSTTSRADGIGGGVGNEGFPKIG